MRTMVTEQWSKNNGLTDDPPEARRRIHLGSIIADSVDSSDGCEHQVPGEGQCAGPCHTEPVWHDRLHLLVAHDAPVV